MGVACASTSAQPVARRIRARPAGRPDRARRATRVAAERARHVGRARRPGGNLRRPRDPPPPRRGPARVGCGPRRHGSGGDRHARRARASPRSGSRRTSRSSSRSPTPAMRRGHAPWGADVRLGGGPTVFRGPVVSPIVGDGLLAVAAEARHHGRDRDRQGHAYGRRRRLHDRCRRRLRHRLHPAPLHALGRRDRPALGRGRCLTADRGVRPIAHRRDLVPALSSLRRGSYAWRYAGTMSRSVIVSTVRTPFGRLGGGLAKVPATELGAIAIRAGLERAGHRSGRGRAT